jgi:hypothetical protein
MDKEYAEKYRKAKYIFLLPTQPPGRLYFNWVWDIKKIKKYLAALERHSGVII